MNDDEVISPTLEDIARRYRTRAGFRLADYGEVGLPVYRLTIQAMLLLRKPLSPIDEFVLKSLNAGLPSAAEISEFLGLERLIVDDALVGLVRSDDVYLAAPPGSRTQVLSLTQKGTQTLAQAQTIVPEERTLQIDFDGIVRKPLPVDRGLLKARDLREEGIKEVPPFRKRPELDELKVKEVDFAIRRTLGGRDTGRELLAIKAIERRDHFHQKAIALVYKAEQGDDVQVGFAIDGRLSPEHEEAFARLDGPRKLGITQQLSSMQYAQVPGELFDELSQAAPPLTNLEDLQSTASSAQAELQDASNRALEAQTAAERSAAEDRISSLNARVAELEVALSSIPIRPVEVYEHPPLLEKALNESKERLLIISPWIRAKVVNRRFVQRLEDALRRKVQVYIGYGLGEEEDFPNPVDQRAEQDLLRLAARYDNFTFVRLGDTHAKVLLCDRQFMIFTSFNWLSFRGDPNRTFRDEQGLLVAIPEKVDENFVRLVARLNPPEKPEA